MMERPSQTGVFLLEKDVAVAATEPTVDVEDVLKQQEEEEEEELNEKYPLPAHLKHKSIAIHPLPRFHAFLVPYSSHPIYSPHPHVRSSSLPESRQPSFIF
jgi:hypothetical protein